MTNAYTPWMSLAHAERNTVIDFLGTKPTNARRRLLAKARRLRHLAALARQDDLGTAKGKSESYYTILAATLEYNAA